MKKTKLAGIVNIITSARIVGGISLLLVHPFSIPFYGIYLFSGLTDALDGFLARLWHVESDKGAKLDSVADLIFYIVLMIRILPTLVQKVPKQCWYLVTVILVIRIGCYIITALRHGALASLHTWANKLTGALVFLVPLLIQVSAVIYPWIVCIVALIAALEELAIHLIKGEEHSNVKGIWDRK